jgi:hypothetical protein
LDVSWIKPLIDAGGWTACAAVLGSVIALMVTGRLVPGSVLKAVTKRLDAIEETQREDIVPAIKEIGRATTSSAIADEYLVDFVRDTIRERERRGT